MKNFRKFSVCLIGGLLWFSSCKKDEHDHDHSHKHDNELITRVTIRLQNVSNANDTILVAWKGKMMGNVVVPDKTDTLSLGASKLYNGRIRFFDDVNSKEITSEIERESKEHLLYYTYTPVSGGNASDVVVEGRNTDPDGKPLGTTFRLRVNASSVTSGTLKVDLRHFSGTAKQDNPNAGSSDFSGVFPVLIR
ncbi:MAG: hypothetical protein NZM38_05015 [Cytophagales bacterium]|nr:hypothetical protein [Cytophagales bacterium]MDW8384113.1 hypothetical protein [Flammeovirgaceae bacterium]